MLFASALATGFASVEYMQYVNALSIDFGDFHMSLDNLQGPKGDKGDPGDPCPHQSKLLEHPNLDSQGENFENGIDRVFPANPTTGQDPTVVCVP